MDIEKERLKTILIEMGKEAFTIDEKADFLIKNSVIPIIKCSKCRFGTGGTVFHNFIYCARNGEVMNNDNYCNFAKERD